jgi:hypothetical protein
MKRRDVQTLNAEKCGNSGAAQKNEIANPIEELIYMHKHEINQQRVCFSFHGKVLSEKGEWDEC